MKGIKQKGKKRNAKYEKKVFLPVSFEEMVKLSVTEIPNKGKK